MVVLAGVVRSPYSAAWLTGRRPPARFGQDGVRPWERPRAGNIYLPRRVTAGAAAAGGVCRPGSGGAPLRGVHGGLRLAQLLRTSRLQQHPPLGRVRPPLQQSTTLVLGHASAGTSTRCGRPTPARHSVRTGQPMRICLARFWAAPGRKLLGAPLAGRPAAPAHRRRGAGQVAHRRGEERSPGTARVRLQLVGHRAAAVAASSTPHLAGRKGRRLSTPDPAPARRSWRPAGLVLVSAGGSRSGQSAKAHTGATPLRRARGRSELGHARIATRSLTGGGCSRKSWPPTTDQTAARWVTSACCVATPSRLLKRNHPAFSTTRRKKPWQGIE